MFREERAKLRVAQIRASAGLRPALEARIVDKNVTVRGEPVPRSTVNMATVDHGLATRRALPFY
jgi:hypothetical protein